jgi:hypothetical protein
VNELAPQEKSNIAAVVDDLIARGDLSRLTSEQRVVHYHNVCQSLGLNPLTQPFQYVTLNGKLQLYARKDATDQLRRINGINIKLEEPSVHEGMLTIHARATDKTGRTDEDFGVVAVSGLRGDAAANAFMKAVTKAKRRVTLSISGLGFPDESEISDVASHSFAHLSATDLPQQTIEQPREPEHTKPTALAIPTGDEAWRPWATSFITAVRGTRSLAELEEWEKLNEDALLIMRENEPKMHRMLATALEQQRELRKGETAGAATQDDAG